MTEGYIPVDQLMAFLAARDEDEGGMVSTTCMRAFATVHRVTADSVAFAHWVEQEPTPTADDLQALENRR